MKRPKLLISLLLLCSLITGCTNPKRMSPSVDNRGLFTDHGLRFVVAADPQLFRGKKEDLDRAIRLINEQTPEFVVMCGDMVETSGNLQQIQAYKDAVSKLSPQISLYNVSGNHDLGLPVKKEKINIYQEHFGPLWFHFTYGNSLFIAFSSDIMIDFNSPMHKQQKDWLTGIFDKLQSEPVENIFVFMHHPLYLNTPDEPDGYSNMPIGIRKELLDVFAERRVRAVFSGHLHDNRINNYRGVDLITTNSITAPMGKDPAGFHIVEVNQRGYEHRYVSVESPGKQKEDSYEQTFVP